MTGGGCVVVFGREPVPGRVKTRLAADLGFERAAGVYRCLLDHTLEVALQSAARVVLSLAAPPSPGWSPGHEVAMEMQGRGDLGRRMSEAFARRFGGGSRRVVIIGSDCPQLAPQHLDHALERLRTAAVVLGPAADGGYWLVGQHPPGLDLFSGIPWSSAQTLQATRQRLSELGVECVEVETLRDLDTADDLEQLLVSGTLAPALAAALRLALEAG